MKFLSLPLLAAFLLSAACATRAVSEPRPRFSATQVTKLADARAIAEGYAPRKYTRKDPEYDSSTGEWSVFYSGKPQHEDGRPLLIFGDHYIVYVVDKTGETRITHGR